MPDRPDRPPPLALAAAAAVALATAVLFLPARDHTFSKFDDPGYVLRNPHVARGLTPHGVAWAFTETRRMGNWHPLTWLSHMLDVELSGLEPAGHHLTSVVLHALNAGALVLALWWLTGAILPAALAAALFALHPLRVESVAWIAERKDVLSGFFFVLALIAWARWTRAPSAGRYAAVVAAFAAGLMAKPMVVTLPFVLLLLDAWPLGRGLTRRTVVEKLPLFALSAASAAVTTVAQGNARAVQSADVVSFGARLLNAPLAVLAYLRKTAWPDDLAIFYPHPFVGREPGGAVVALAVVGGAALLAATALAARRARGPVAVGWLWFAGMLVPTLGLVQVGAQGHADRYTYLPSIGLAVAVAYGLRRRVALAAVALALVPLAATTRAQLDTWRNSRVMYEHALAVTEDNHVAHTGLGVILLNRGELDAAEVHLRAALAVQPTYFPAASNLGTVFLQRGDLDAAEEQFRAALDLRADADVHNNLGMLALRRGDEDAAVVEFGRALALNPDSAEAHNNLGMVLANRGELERAEEHFRRAVELMPQSPQAQANLARLRGRRP